MVSEFDTHQVINFPLMPIGSRPDAGDAGALRHGAPVGPGQGHSQANTVIVRDGVQLIDRDETGFDPLAEAIHAGQVEQQVVMQVRGIAEKASHIQQSLTIKGNGDIAAKLRYVPHRIRELGPDLLGRELIHPHLPCVVRELPTFTQLCMFLNLLLKQRHGMKQRLRTRGAAGHVHVHRNQLVHSLDNGVVVERAAH